MFLRVSVQIVFVYEYIIDNYVICRYQDNIISI